MASETLNLILKTTGDRLVVDAIGAARAAIQALSGAIAATVGAAIESENANRRLATALEISGRGGQVALDSMLAYSDQLSKVTLFTDEAITESQALLAQLTKLDQEGIQKATRAAIGLSTTFGIDLQTATETIAKATQGNTTALSKYVGKLDETLPPSQRLEEALSRLEKGFKLAQGQSQTTGGQLDLFKKATGELFEEIGKSVTSAFSDSGLIGFMTKWINKMTEGAAHTRELLKLRDQGLSLADAEAKLLADSAAKEAERLRQDAIQRKIAIDEKKRLDAQFLADKLKKEREAADEAQRIIQDKADKEKALSDKAFEEQQKVQQQRLALVQSTLSQISQFETSNHKALFIAAKAAAIANIVINTSEGIIRAAKIPFIGIPLAATIAAIGAAQIAKVTGVNLAEGGLVNPRRGGIQATIGEGRSAEAVIPLESSRARRAIGNSIGGPSMIQIQLMLDRRELANTIIDLKRQGALQGKVG